MMGGFGPLHPDDPVGIGLENLAERRMADKWCISAKVCERHVGRRIARHRDALAEAETVVMTVRRRY